MRKKPAFTFTVYIMYLLLYIWTTVSNKSLFISSKSLFMSVCVLSFQRVHPQWKALSKRCVSFQEMSYFSLAMNLVCWRYGSITLWLATSRWRRAPDKRCRLNTWVFVLLNDMSVCQFSGNPITAVCSMPDNQIAVGHMKPAVDVFKLVWNQQRSTAW